MGLRSGNWLDLCNASKCLKRTFLTEVCIVDPDANMLLLFIFLFTCSVLN